MIATSCVATTRLSASSLSGLLFLVTGAGRVSIVGCRARAGPASDFYAADLDAEYQRKAQGVEPAKKSFAFVSHHVFPRLEDAQ